MYRKLLIAVFFIFHSAISFGQNNTLDAPLKPVVVTGDAVAGFNGVAVNELFLYAFADASWQVIPFQIDELSENNRYTEEELFNGLLDANEEIVFMAKDAGSRAVGTWIDNSESQAYPRYEFQVSSGDGEAWVYLYRIPSNQPELSSIDYVDYIKPPEGTVADAVVAEGVYKVEAAANGFPGSLYVYDGGTGVDVLQKQQIEITIDVGFGLGILNEEDNFVAKAVSVKDGRVRVVRELTADIVTALSPDPAIEGLVFPINYYGTLYEIKASLNITADLFASLPIPIKIVQMKQAFVLNDNAIGLSFFNAVNSAIPVDGVADVNAIDSTIVTDEAGVNRFLFKGAQANFITEYIVPGIGDAQWLFYEDNAASNSYGSAGFKITGANILGEAPLGLSVVFPGAVADGSEDEYITTENDTLSTTATSQNYDEVTSVSTLENTFVPEQFELAQNYPNPFNPTTKIQFSIPTQSDVNITVYNLLGNEITTLVNKEFLQGNYSVSWNGKDSSGDEVAAGVYIYQLKAGSIIQTRKMLLIK